VRGTTVVAYRYVFLVVAGSFVKSQGNLKNR